MKCKCGAKMRLLNLPDETFFNETNKHRLWVCSKCGNEKEFVGGGKNR